MHDFGKTRVRHGGKRARRDGRHTLHRFEYALGPSVGFNVAKNMWVSLGYNFQGLEDRDFSDACFMQQGPYVRFRMKFDQESAKEMVKWIGWQ